MSVAVFAVIERPDRAEFSYVKTEDHTFAVQKDGGRINWLNFAGGVANDIISSHLARTAGIS